VDRKDLANIFYGEGRVPPPWATDCPVRFDTWFEFAQPSSAPPPRRVDLILAVHEEHGVRRVLDHLTNLGVLALCQAVAAGSFVAARLTLDELVRAVLPMTNLFGVVRYAQQIPLSDLRAAAVGQGSSGIGSAPAASEDGIERQDERKRHLVWLLRLLLTVTESAATPIAARRESATVLAGRRATALDAIVAALQQAMAERTITQLPGAPNNQIIDRRRRYPIVSVTTNRKAAPAVSRSRQTVKADAAETVFAVDCRTVGWAVVDSGIDAVHPAFVDLDIAPALPGQRPSRIVRAFAFVGARETLFGDRAANGLVDWTNCLPFLEMPLPNQPPVPGSSPPQHPYSRPADPHGTHVAGVLGANWPERGLRGMCPNIRLYDFRVLDDAGQGDEFAIVMALQAIRHINEQAGRLAIAGVNLSLSVPHDVATHSCGWTPVCIECDRLVRSGVVVVTSAGNTGFTGGIQTTGTDYHTVSISDPGNTDGVLTVGSTHRSDPHRHGVSYFSSRGPTADGRLKPDVLAPGEDIDGPVPGDGISAMHGTSQAAAHVSGAAAMLIARHRELLGWPDRIKQILCSTATDLGRERSFQGNGLIDVLRAMQSV
jgi:hypothetical protein